MKRFLSHDVAAAVVKCDRCTVDDLTPMFPGVSREKLLNALWVANRRGSIGLIRKGRGWQRGQGKTPGSGQPGVWGPPTASPEVEPDEPGPDLRRPHQAVVSVFHLGTGAITLPARPEHARMYQLLGEW